jgi:hypothetical protein
MKKSIAVLVFIGLIASAYFTRHQKMTSEKEAMVKNAAAETKAEAARTVASAPATAAPSPENKIEGHFLKQSLNTEKYSPGTREKLQTLNDIMISKNDNDPRLDKDLKNLSPEDKLALKDFYTNLKAESLNEKGTVVFLLGRDIQNVNDVDFMKNVLGEEPCLSMDNCLVKNVSADSHIDSVNQTTLTYPQQVALESLLRWANKNPQSLTSDMRQHLAEAVQQAKRSPVASIQRKADEISKKFKL